MTGVAVGDDVFGLGHNTHAEYAVLDSWARKPASVDWAVAAAAGQVAETAERTSAAAGLDRGSTISSMVAPAAWAPLQLRSPRLGVPP